MLVEMRGVAPLSGYEPLIHRHRLGLLKYTAIAWSKRVAMAVGACLFVFTFAPLRKP